MKQYFKGCLISCADATDYPSVDVALQGYGYRIVELDGKRISDTDVCETIQSLSKEALRTFNRKSKIEITSPQIIASLNNAIKCVKLTIYENDVILDLMYEKVEDQEGNIYARELLSGKLFPISDKYTEFMKYTITNIPACPNASTFTIKMDAEYRHPNYEKIYSVMMFEEVADKNDLDEYLNKYDRMFFGEYKKQKRIDRIVYESNKNVLSEEVEVTEISRNRKTKTERQSQNTLTISMENIEYMISRLESINPERSKYYSEEYERALNSVDIMQNKRVSETSIISLEARLEFELMFTKGENTSLTEKLDELKKEYLSHFIEKTQEKTSITLDDLDKLMELFLKTKDSYSILEQRKILRNFATIYTLEVKENIKEIDSNRLKDSYFNDLKKSIILSIKSLIQTGLFKSNIQFELSTDESIENILELIRSLEIEKTQEEPENSNQKNLKMSEKITFYT